MGIVVAEFRQQSPNGGNPTPGAPDEVNRFRNGLLLIADLPEEETFELPAIGGSLRINPAEASDSQRAARLRKLKADGCGIVAWAANGADGQTEFLQTSPIVAGLQFDGAKEGAVAAHAAVKAEIVG